MHILETLGLPRPEPLRPLPRHPARPRSRRARGVAHRPARARVHRRAASPRCRACASTAAPTASRAASVRRLHGGRGHLARPRARARRDRAAERRRRARSPSARRARPARPASYHVVYRVRAGGGRPRGGQPRADAAALACCRQSSGPPAAVPDELRLRRGARRVHPLRAAPRARPEHRVAGARRRGARHPLDPAQRPQPGPVRPRQVPAAHPGHHHQPARPTSRSRSPPTRRRPTRSSRDLGLPVPQQRLVQREDEAVRRRASGSAIPVVVKPLNANHGRGVSINLTRRRRRWRRRSRRRRRAQPQRDRRELHRRATTTACWWSTASWSRWPSGCRGTSSATATHTIEELVDDREQRSAPRHRPREGADAPRVRLTRPSGCWRSRATPRQTVPPAGEVVYLRSTGNLSTGGTAIDVTDIVHPDNREMAVRAVKAIGLDVGGVDFLTPDITAVVQGDRRRHLRGERRARLPHARRAERGQAARRRRAGDGHAVPAGHARSRIPIAAITGTNGKTTTARMLAHIHKLAGQHVGLTTTDGVYIDGQRTVRAT